MGRDLQTDSRRATPSRHVTKIPSPRLLLFADFKTAWVCTNHSHKGIRFLTNQEIGFPPPHPIKSPHCLHSAGNWTGQTRNHMSKTTDANNRMNRPLDGV